MQWTARAISAAFGWANAPGFPPGSESRGQPCAVRHRWPCTIQAILLAIVLELCAPRGSIAADALARLTPQRLEAVRQAVAALKAQRRPQARSGPFQVYRAAIHLHSAWSHDSRGTLEEIVAAAKATGTRVLMFSEHPSDRYDPCVNGHRGLHDGVLVIPGVEAKGFLAFPTQGLRGLDADSPQAYSDRIRGKGGLVFLSHLEERMDWEIRGLTGVEIYNAHADFKDEKKLAAALRNPLWLMTSIELFRKYPQEAFSAVQDYPADYLRRWDQLCARAPHTGVAANDSHQNVGLVMRLGEGGKVRVEDALGKNLFEAPLVMLPFLQPHIKDKKAGDVLLRLQLDPYENSLRHVGTHLVMRELSEKAVWEALEAGRALVAFDWIADPAGFDFAAVAGSRRYEMGSQPGLQSSLRLHAQAPLAVQWKLLRNGTLQRRSEGRSLDVPVTEPGIYRVEAWLTLAGEEMPWILSNPIYVRAVSASKGSKNLSEDGNCPPKAAKKGR